MKVIISGGGIGGLTAALLLAERGIEATVYEQADDIRELGVGLQIAPEASAVLVAAGLGPQLAAAAVSVREAIYLNRFGQIVWREPRDGAAATGAPFLAVHRGRLLRVLVEAVMIKGGAKGMRAGAQVAAITEEDGGVSVTLKGRDGRSLGSDRADVVIAAEGINSPARRRMYPKEGPPRWSGVMLWRGALEMPQFLDGRTMVVAGGIGCKCVVVPLGAGAKPGTQLIHWMIGAKTGEPGRPPHREDWSRPGKLADLLPHLGRFAIPGFDPAALAKASPSFWEYPMIDRDPLDAWTNGRVTLLGDAAHPIHPVGSHAPSQAILDAAALAECLAAGKAGGGSATDALAAYEAARRGPTAAIQRSRRAGGPEQIIDRFEALAPDGFTDIDAVLSHVARQEIVTAAGRPLEATVATEIAAAAAPPQ